MDKRVYMELESYKPRNLELVSSDSALFLKNIGAVVIAMDEVSTNREWNRKPTTENSNIPYQLVIEWFNFVEQENIPFELFSQLIKKYC